MYPTLLTVIIPARNEAKTIGDCLRALLSQRLPEAVSVHIIVVANGCTDTTALVARAFTSHLAVRGIGFKVVETAVAGKAHALNLGDRLVEDGARVYLDADVRCAPDLLRALA
jgi:glycosyltransferase involved in cell wall biosynthesis